MSQDAPYAGRGGYVVVCTTPIARAAGHRHAGKHVVLLLPRHGPCEGGMKPSDSNHRPIPLTTERKRHGTMLEGPGVQEAGRAGGKRKEGIDDAGGRAGGIIRGGSATAY